MLDGDCWWCFDGFTRCRCGRERHCRQRAPRKQNGSQILTHYAQLLGRELYQSMCHEKRGYSGRALPIFPAPELTRHSVEVRVLNKVATEWTLGLRCSASIRNEETLRSNRG